MIPQTPSYIRLHIERQTPNAGVLGDHLRSLFNRSVQVGDDVTVALAQYRAALATAAVILGVSVQDLIDAYDLRLTSPETGDH